jgi:phosphate/sulfate permease
MIREILLAWVATLPLGAALAGLTFLFLRGK